MIQSDDDSLLAFLVNEVERLALEAGKIANPATLLDEAQELLAIRERILLRRFKENQLPLPLERAAA